jgi:hypothetical protein
MFTTTRLIGAALAGAMTAATMAGDIIAPAGWWQFDRNRLTADEVGNDTLNALPLPAVGSSFDAELVFRVPAAPALAASIQVNNSVAPFHWSTAWTGMTFSTFHLVRSPLAAGAPQSIAGRWPDDETGTWRMRVVPTAAGEAMYRAEIGTSAGTVVLEMPAPIEQWAWLFLAIDTDGLTASLELRDLAGEVVDSVTTELPDVPQVAITPLTLGRGIGENTGGVEVRMDIVAGWPTVLDDANRRATVDADGPTRYIEFMGWRGFGDPGRNMERVGGIVTGDRRHVVVGDSFAFAAGWNRVFPAILRVRRFEPFVGLAAGVRSVHTLIKSEPLFEDPGPLNPRGIGQQTQYQCEWIGGTSPADVYGLPTNVVTELRGHPGAIVPPDGGLMQFTVANGGMASGETGRFSRAGDRVAWRLVHRRTSDAVSPLPSVRLTDLADEASVTVDLTAGLPREAATTPHALITEVPADGVTRATMREATPGDFAAGPERFGTLASVMAWRVGPDGERLPGQYYTSLHDSSWSWQDFGRDVESRIPSPLKSISKQQLVTWLTATTLDPEQPLAFWWYVDTEDRAEASLQSMMRSAFDMADAACAEAGLPRPVHLAVVPHLHQTTGEKTRDQLWEIFDRYQRALDSIVDDPAYDHVARYSIFEATDGVMFDARPESIAWLAANGYDAFSYGTVTADLTTEGPLLDQFDAHPQDPISAAFFASFVGAAIPASAEPRPCLGDATGDGRVDFNDLLAVIELWGPCPAKGECAADLDEDGMVGLGDLLEVLGYWGTCLPAP